MSDFDDWLIHYLESAYGLEPEVAEKYIPFHESAFLTADHMKAAWQASREGMIKKADVLRLFSADLLARDSSLQKIVRVIEDMS